MKKCISLFLALSIGVSSMSIAKPTDQQIAVERQSDFDYGELASVAFFFAILPAITMLLGNQGSEPILRGAPTNAIT